jgi:hypothetical protein
MPRDQREGSQRPYYRFSRPVLGTIPRNNCEVTVQLGSKSKDLRTHAGDSLDRTSAATFTDIFRGVRFHTLFPEKM